MDEGEINVIPPPSRPSSKGRRFWTIGPFDLSFSGALEAKVETFSLRSKQGSGHLEKRRLDHYAIDRNAASAALASGFEGEGEAVRELDTFGDTCSTYGGP